VRARIETRSARLRLSGRKAPYWTKIERGLSVGYHRPIGGGAGTWWGRVVVGDRYRIESRATADDYQDADGETVLNWSQAQAAVRTWATKQTVDGPLTVAGAVAAYVEDLYARRGTKAGAGVEGRLKKHLLPVLGEVRLSDLTHTEFLAWRNALVDLSDDPDAVRRSRDTANRVLGMARAAFNMAFNAGRVTDDRAWRRVRAFKGVGQARKVILSDAETQRLIDACGPGLRELALIGAWTGARLGELTSLRVRDFDHVDATLTASGKTGERVIHLDPQSTSLLRQLASGKRTDGYLLTDEGGKRWTPNGHSKKFAAAVALAGLDPATTFYALRHSYISRALASGVPIGAVAAHCGTSARMIEIHYAKWVSSDQKRFAILAAPPLRIDVDKRVVALRPGVA
jgi:integrase